MTLVGLAVLNLVIRAMVRAVVLAMFIVQLIILMVADTSTSSGSRCPRWQVGPI
jgi:hypothetical protein